MEAPDEREAKPFRFSHLIDEDEPRWGWQRDFLRLVHGSQRLIVLKARQLGVTWLACAYVVWTALYKPGSLCLVYRQKEEESVENVVRCWRLIQSLPPWMMNGAEPEIPSRGSDPRGGEIALRFPDGSLSRILAMSSASASGHGKTAAVVLLDEFSRIDRASEIMKAVQPAAGKAGKILIISTANGLSNAETGEGNYFHYLWSNAEDSGFDKEFLGWDKHPDRDQQWYESDPEVRGLRDYERAEQYPSNEYEAFALTQNNFFEEEEYKHYAERVPKQLYRFSFEKAKAGYAKQSRRKDAPIRVYREPVDGRRYAIGVDVASGTGLDFSAAVVIDLTNMEISAEFYDRLDPDLYAMQLHYLGRWYNNALIAVENQGGYGIAVINALRDGRSDRPAYPNLYRHILTNRPDLQTAKPYGIPMGSKQRDTVIELLGQAVREGYATKGEDGLPYLSEVALNEAQTFIRSPQPGQSQRGPWPRAMDGCHDDMLMALAIALWLYRRKGFHPDRKPRRNKPPRWRGRKSLLAPGEIPLDRR